MSRDPFTSGAYDRWRTSTPYQDAPDECATCGGEGYVEVPGPGGDPQKDTRERCPACGDDHADDPLWDVP